RLGRPQPRRLSPREGPASREAQDGPRTARASVRVLAAGELEDPADESHDAEGDADTEEPPADRETREGDGRRRSEDEGPPAPRAELALLPGAVGDLAVRVVLGPFVDAARHEPQVRPDHADQAAQERDAEH